MFKARHIPSHKTSITGELKGAIQTGRNTLYDDFLLQLQGLLALVESP